jgi:hypothetical protein
VAVRATRRVPTSSGKLPARVERLIGLLRSHLPALQQRYGVRTLGVFGSYIRGEEGKTSDLDLLVEFDRAPTLLEFVRLERHVSELLGVSVDLVMKTALKPAIGRRILEEVVPV